MTILDVIVDKVIKIKSKIMANTSVFVLYFFGLISALYWYNPHHITMSPSLCITGYILNYTVMTVNNGKMPICFPQELITDTHIYTAIKKTGSDKTKLNILGDWIPSAKNGYCLTSPGDILIKIGPLVTAIEIFFFV